MTSSRTNRTRIGMEALETRDQMSVSAVLDITAGILTFTGDVGGVSNDYIEIEDTGLAGGGQVRYRTVVGGAWTTVGNEVWRIALDTKAGNDTVVHRIGRSPNFAVNGVASGLYREVRGGVNALGGLGSGDDRFTSTVYGNIGNGTANTGYGLFLHGGTENDRLGLSVNGDILNRGTIGVSLTGGTGVDFMDAFLTNDVDIATGGMFWMNMYGEAGNDNQQLHYRGEMDGRLLFSLNGQGDSDWVRAHITIDANSTGTLGGNGYSANRVDGGDGNDTVEFGVYNIASMIPCTCEIYGGAGTDTIKSSQLWVTRVDWVPGEPTVNLPN